MLRCCSSTRRLWSSIRTSSACARSRSDSAWPLEGLGELDEPCQPASCRGALQARTRSPRLDLCGRHRWPPRSGRVVSQCYPYTTIVGADELGYERERPLYKRKPKGLSAAAWRPVRAAACDVLIQRIADLRNASPPLDLRSHPVTAQLLDERSPLDDRAYKHREVLIDACLAAWTAALWIRSADRYQVLGEHDVFVDDRGQRATIVAPARPSQRPNA